PSSAREQDGARPRTFSTLDCTACTTWLFCSAVSGGSTSVIGVRVNGPVAVSRPELSSRLTSLGNCSASAGIRLLTVPSTTEPRMAEASPGTGTEVSGSANTQATTKTTAHCTTAPSV